LTITEAIKQVRARSDQQLAETTRRPSMFIQTFGCQMNVRESEKLHGLLLEMGYSLSPSEKEADLVVYNTCSVRESAENKVFGKLGYLKAYKAEQPGKIIVLCGCMPQRESVMEEIRRHHSHIDIIFGTYNKHHFPQLLFEHLTHGQPVVELLNEHSQIPEEAFDGQTTRFSPHKAGVTIMHGCDNFCAYCIVPAVRGRERSRPSQDILTEIEALAADGVREVMLLGQNVNSYGRGLSESISFADLLVKINAISEIRRIRFMTSHPKDLSDDLISAIRDSEKVCKHIHLPMQAGSTQVLERMNRGYTKEGYLQLVDRLRAKLPNIAITTDIIVGFPGETEANFEDTLDAAQRANFAGAFTFLYSPREGTPAADFDDEISKEIADARFRRLLDIMNPMQLEYNRQYINKVVEVMTDGKADSSGTGRFTGRTGDNLLVHFESAIEVKPGDCVMVEITECKTFYMKGRVV